MKYEGEYILIHTIKFSKKKKKERNVRENKIIKVIRKQTTFVGFCVFRMEVK